MNRLRVAVIGGGGAGLCAARYMAARPDKFEPVVFEKAENVGGTWVYTEETGKDKYGYPIHSSMYSSLRTNLPKEVMAFPDFPFDSSLPSFIKHTDVLKYIEQYAQHFNLLKYIQFCKVVELVRPISSADDTKHVSWEVTVRDVRNLQSESTTEKFDAVIVCNGHYAVPKVPTIPGLDTFSGEVLHSHEYRHPSIFNDQTVLIIGAGASGIDIALDISSKAKQVYISHWKPRIASTLPENIKEVQAVKAVSSSEAIFTDDARVDIDAILFCTGYNYDFSFLHTDCKVNVGDGRVTPLYKHVLHSTFPSLSFIGITMRICPFPQFAAQCQFALAALDGSMKLPSRIEMEANEAEDYQNRLDQGLPHRYAHFMGMRQWDYNADLLRQANLDQHAPVVEKLYDAIAVERKRNVCHYKNINFKLIDGNNFETLQSVEQ
ncbi:uncharacterized protein [Diadema antillarum]|uniref:uncharacterized protein n=1 Tax=Diadema antillarum TaxID=105358 RepID=UPI003A894F70